MRSGLSWGCFCCANAPVYKASRVSWTNPISAPWEEMNWSLGQLPGPGQAVFIETPGWKAVAIGAGTVKNFPQSVRPSSITISAPEYSSNVLLLNYSGFATPVSVRQLRIYANGTLTALHSALEVNNALGGAFSIGGALNQGEDAIVSTASVQVGDVGPGAYNLTNGTLSGECGCGNRWKFSGAIQSVWRKQLHGGRRIVYFGRIRLIRRQSYCQQCYLSATKLDGG